MTSLGVPVVMRRVSAIWDTINKPSYAAGVGSNCRCISCASKRFCVSRSHCERVCWMPLLGGSFTDALLPPARFAARVHAGNDADQVGRRDEVDGVREAAQQGATALQVDHREALGHAPDLGEGDVDRAQELRAVPRPVARSSYQRAAAAMSASAAERTTRRGVIRREPTASRCERARPPKVRPRRDRARGQRGDVRARPSGRR